MKKHGRAKETMDNPVLENAIASRSEEGKIPCAVAMRIAAKLGESPLAVGGMLDQMGIRIIKCQLGLFGYGNKRNKKIPAVSSVTVSLAEEIRAILQNGCLPCKAAWALARQKKTSRITVSQACDCLKIKIKPCQLGAF